MSKVIDKKRPVLFEGIRGEYLVGHTDNYIKAQVKGTSYYHNKIIEVDLIENKGSHMIGSK